MVEDCLETDKEDSSFHSSSSSQGIWKNRLVLSILVTETAERVAYFGFRAVLVLYFTHGLKFSESTSVSLCSATVALAYFSPLVGAILADSSWGRFQTIWRFGCLYAAGLSALTWAAFRVQNYEASSSTANSNISDVDGGKLTVERSVTFLGLFFVCMGTGGIKPCVSAFGADQVVIENKSENNSTLLKQEKEKDGFHDEHDEVSYDGPHLDALKVDQQQDTSKEREDRIREFFNSFYFAINVGALGSFVIIPIVRADFGFGASFLIPTVSMILALFIFRIHKNQYKHKSRDEKSQHSLLEVCLVSVNILKTRFYTSKIGRMMFPGGQDPAHSIIPREETDVGNEYEERITPNDSAVVRDATQALHILPLMAFFPIFWMLYDQQGSVWTLQATRMKLYGFEPEQLQFLNPLEIMIFIPLFDQKIYPWLESHGFNISPLRRMEYGMLWTAISFAISALLEFRIQHQEIGTVSVIWQVPQITLLTIGEILLNVTGLEFAYSQAPSNMQAFVLALYLFMTAIGDGLAALLYGSIFAYISSTMAMIICAICMLINMVLFTRVANQWTPYSITFATNGVELGLVHNMEHQH